MKAAERTISRNLFKNKIYESDGQAFEDLFIKIMNYTDIGFQAIKPWGKIGDRKNDGYIKNKGIFFQVYAPEDIRKSYVSLLKKLKDDFEELKNQWQPIREFYFVVNDKYKGVNADCENVLSDIKREHGLVEAGFLTAKDLENLIFKLEADEITNLVGFLPDPASLKLLDYSILNEVIGHIMKMPLQKNKEYEINLPDWKEKLAFNGLSISIARLLDNGYLHIYFLEDYLRNNSSFLAEELRDRVNQVYLEEKENFKKDELFWAVLRQLSPKAEGAYQKATIVIMAKYFETCDIFEDPSLGV